MTGAGRRVVRTGAAALALGLAVGACSSDADGPDEAPSGESPSAAPEHSMETRVTFGEVTGKLAPRARQRLSAQVGEVVDGWLEAAYLGDDYPRRPGARAWADAWPGFTPGAQQRAREDRALMSNADIGDRIEAVDPHRARVVLDVLAVKGTAAGVTARVFLGFATTGEVEREVRVRGRLFLTWTGRAWRVFGYDVTKGTA